MLLPFSPGITGHCAEKGNVFTLELRSLRKLSTKTFVTKDQTVINTIKQGFSPILEDYLSDYLPGFGDTFLEMQSHLIPVDGKERVFKIAQNTKMKFCWIPAGKAMLGSPKNEKGRHQDEKEHEFETNGFWVGKYPVTQIQWKTVMGDNPSVFKGDNLPVEMVDWEDCQEFLNNCSVVGLRVQLPHEDQWEYACRGGRGNKQPFYWGNTLNGDKANCDGTVPYGTDEKGTDLENTSEVGSYEKVAPHPWNLCDMSGNVWEWCSNLHSKEGSSRMVRGGGWGIEPKCCRSSYRDWMNSSYYDEYLGLRLIVC